LATSDASTQNIPWYSPAKLWGAVKGWWNTQAVIDTDQPYVKAMLELKLQCQQMINQASEVTSDCWYGYSLEDLVADIDETLKQGESIDKETVSVFKKRLRGIEKDFVGGEFVQEQAIPYLVEKADSQLAQPGFGMPASPMLPYQGAAMLALGN
jgi:hypothetical protein